MPDVRITVLCEGNEDRTFLTRLLKKYLGLTGKSFEVRKVKGEANLKRAYKPEVDAIGMHKSNGYRLLLCIDGDRYGWKFRCDEASKLCERELPNIVYGIVPEIELEHWILLLIGEAIEEKKEALTTKLKDYAATKINQAVDAFVAGLNLTEPPKEWSDSLKLAHDKLTKLKSSLAEAA